MHAIPGTSLPSYRLYAAIPMSGIQNYSTSQDTIPLNMKKVAGLLQFSLILALSDASLFTSSWVINEVVNKVSNRGTVLLITLITDPTTNMIEKVPGVITSFFR